jgi:dihydrofolate reductase
MRVSVYIAASLDGFIARPDGDIDWLHAVEDPEGEDYGYYDFLDSVDAIVMGRHTFEKVLTFGGWPFDDAKRVVVLSSTLAALPTDLPATVTLAAGTPAEVLAQLATEGIGQIYLDGGQTIQRFLAAGLVSRLIVTRIPVVLGRGIPLFGPLDEDVWLTHTETKSFSNGLVQSTYEVA